MSRPTMCEARQILMGRTTQITNVKERKAKQERIKTTQKGQGLPTE